MPNQPFPHTSCSLLLVFEIKNTAALLRIVQVINLDLFVGVELQALQFHHPFPSF